MPCSHSEELGIDSKFVWKPSELFQQGRELSVSSVISKDY